MAGERNRKLMHRVVMALRKAYGRYSATTKEAALEEMLLGILAMDVRERKALTALRSLEQSFVDWNEVRVSSALEIADAMPAIPDGVLKAEIIRAILRNVYDTTNEMSLDFLKEKGPRDVLRLISGIHGFPEPALARAVLNGLGHDVMPLTADLVAFCRRVGLLPKGNDYATLARHMERALARQNMLEFHWLVYRHTSSVCKSADPACLECVLQSNCRTGKSKASRTARAMCAAKKTMRATKVMRAVKTSRVRAKLDPKKKERKKAKK